MLNTKKRHLLSPKAGCDWADKMVLNPAMVRDPQNSGTIHMLFRATGPWARAAQPGQPLPYPIFLGYGVSRDNGENWEFDFSGPAMAPRLDFDRENFIRNSFRNGKMFDYANGCIEDPRLFYFENELYLSVACRAFAPGPYWEHDDPVQCMPGWAHDPALGRAVVQNSTVSMLYKVDLAKLAARQYQQAFAVGTPMHQPDKSDDRDVMLFPRRLNIGGKAKIVCLHRPKDPQHYEIGKDLTAPSIFLAAADTLDGFYRGEADMTVLAKPEFAWEANRIGASWAPLEVKPGTWLLPYHGKQDDRVGYTQSFMILQENGTLNLDIRQRPADRLLYAAEPWELEGEFAIPCLFTCSGIVLEDGRLLMGYGAADKQVGLAEVSYQQLLQYLGVCGAILR